MNYIIDNWNEDLLKLLIYSLQKISDEKYKNFNDKIINTTSKTIGVQIPKIRVIAKQICKGNVESFLKLKMPDIYELHILYALVLSSLKDNNKAYPLFTNFIKTINNWAVCDIFCGEFKIVKQHKEFYLNVIKNLVKNDKEFVVRVGLILLMKFYINTNINDIFKIINTINCNKYYVNMGIAWLLSMCYIYDEKKTLDFIETSTLTYFIKNKTYQKILESRQVTQNQKTLVKQLKSKLKNIDI